MAVANSTTTDTPEESPSDSDTWRPGGWHVAALCLAIAFAAAVGGWMFGARDSAPGEGSADVGFLQDMIAHHEQAIMMAKLETSSGDDTTAKTFAREIVEQQSYEIGLMQRQLEAWGHPRYSPDETAMTWMGERVGVDEMPGLASEDELVALADRSGAEADALFVALMKDHHAGGVAMAKAAAAMAKDPFVRDLAARMARNQAIEIREFEQARIRAGLPADPPGYLPADIPAHDGHR